MHGDCLWPRYKLLLSRIVNCECIKNQLILIYFSSNGKELEEKKLYRIKILFDQPFEDEIKAAFHFLRHQISMNV